MATEKKKIPRGVEQINTGQAFILDVMAIRKMSGKKTLDRNDKMGEKRTGCEKTINKNQIFLMTF